MNEKNYLELCKNDVIKDLGRRNISQNLFKNFKDVIMSQKLPSGYMMPNENLTSEILGVGRSTLREAYTALEVFGFIRRSKGGTYINELSEIMRMAPFSMTVSNSDITDLLEFRYMLEGEIARYAAKRATEDDKEKLEICFLNMQKYKNDIEEFVDYDQMFHSLVADASHNQLLVNTLLASKAPIEKGVRNTLRNSLTENPKAIEVTLDFHEKILQAIQKGDHQTAQSAMHEHISYINLTVKYTL
ncbi:MAG: FadR/GntR family transcriptional regulator [Bacillota bacterium]